jgi:hypothetical protein
MKSTILSSFNNLPYFTIEGFRQLAGENVTSSEHARIALNRWVKAGHLVTLKKGVYMHTNFYELHRHENEFSALVSAVLEPLSYLSMEYVLQQRGTLTEVTYPITAVTPKNTRRIINSLGTFVYRHIQENLYHGYQISEAFGVPYCQASLAKALFDYLYLRPQAAQIASPEYDLSEDLRLNLDEFTPAERNEFAGYVSDSGKAKMKRIQANLENHVWRH